MKHKHNWQFKEERKKLVRIYKPKSILWIFSPLYYDSLVVRVYDYYNVFVCECGEEKEVKIK